MQIEIMVRSPLYATEDENKIKICFENLLGIVPDYKFDTKVNPNIIYAEKIAPKSLGNFYNYIRQNEIIDAVKYCIFVNERNGEVVLSFHKQALYTGKLAIVTDDTSSPLGSVDLVIKPQNINKFLNWLVPETVEGKIVKHSKFNDIFRL